MLSTPSRRIFTARPHAARRRRSTRSKYHFSRARFPMQRDDATPPHILIKRTGHDEICLQALIKCQHLTLWQCLHKITSLRAIFLGRCACAAAAFGPFHCFLVITPRPEVTMPSFRLYGMIMMSLADDEMPSSSLAMPHSLFA